MRYLSLFSGIEAASAAWAPLGWECAGLAEVDPFASAVLAARFPEAPNLGDVTAKTFLRRAKALGAIDLIVGGSPCQAFSVAGLRKGLRDKRGNLTLRFVEICNALDPQVVLWENVPGALSDKTNAFGCLIAGLAGLGAAPVPLSGKWPRAGRIEGRRRRVAWAILDAQYFGVPQRRRRVFVLATPAHAGEHLGAGGLDPSAILALGQGVRGDPSPREDQRERVAKGAADSAGERRVTGFDTYNQDLTGEVAHTLRVATDNGMQSLAARTRGGGGLGTDAEVDGALVAYGGNNTSGPLDVATACNAHGGPHGRLDFESETFVAGTLSSAGGKAAGSATSQDADSGLLVAHSPLVPGYIHPRQIRNSQSSNQVGIKPDAEVADSLTSEGPGGVLQPLPFDTTQITHPENRCQPKPGDPCHPLAAAPAIAFSSKDHGADAGPLSPTLRAAGHDGSHANAGAPPAVAFHLTQDPISGDPISGDPAPALSSGNGQGCATLRVAQPMPFDWKQIGHPANHSSPKVGDPCHPRRGVANAEPAVRLQHGVRRLRRLTPTECEALQGFPRGWTAITYRGKPAADGPRYKALGNSMAVVVMAWLGERIDLFLAPKAPKAPQARKEDNVEKETYVASIESNVKGMTLGAPLALGAKTLIIGPNGAGKSAITNAVELALAGRASDIAGRVEVKAEAILLSLAPGGHPPLVAKATLSDGKTATYEVGTGGAVPGATGPSRAKRARHEGPGPDALPLLPVKEALTGSAEAARAWFLSRLSVSRETILGLLPGGQGLEDLFNAAVADCSVNAPPTTKLLWALSAAKKRARDAGSEARAAVKVTAAAAQGLPPPPAEGELEGARGALKQLEDASAEGRRRIAAVREAEAAVAGRDAAAAATARNAEALASAKAERDRLQATFDAATAALPPTAESAAPRPPETDAAIVLIRHHFRSGASLCYVCDRPLDPKDVVKRATWLEERLGSLATQEQANAKLRAERAAAEEGLKELRAQLRIAERAVTTLEGLVAPAAPAKEPLAPPPAPTETEMAALDAEVAAARKRVEDLVAAQAAWSTSTRQRDAGLEAGREKQQWSEFAGILAGIVSQLLDTGVSRFVAEVRRWLPAGDLFDVELRDGEKEICRWGLRSAASGGHLRTALSGVEWARVTMALALAAAPRQGLQVVIPEDRAWDPDTLGRVLEVLETAPAQILLASPVEPAVLPAGWTVVRVGAATAAAAAPEVPAAPAAPEAQYDEALSAAVKAKRQKREIKL